MALRIEFSNRLDLLADQVADRIAVPVAGRPADPFAIEALIVPSAATGRWLQQRVARRNGVAANLQVELAGRFVWRLFCALLPGLPERSPFDASATVWPAFECLADRDWTARFEGLRGFGEQASDRSRYALARQLAAQYERYLLDRVDWLDRWQHGLGADAGRIAGHRHDAFEQHQAWQAELWRRLLAMLPGVAAEHPARAFVGALARLLEDGREAASVRLSEAMRERFGMPLPHRVTVFGAGARAPLHLEVLAGLSRVVDVVFCVQSPCRQFWQDIVDPRTRARLEAEDPEVALLFEVGHPLLAAWGKAARDALACLDDAAEPHEPLTDDRYVEPRPGSRLAALQAAMLDLSPDATVAGAAADDDSIQVHSAHTPMRQVEVLHDLLLDCFESLDGLGTDEVLVIVPELDRLAPFVTAVFESQPSERRIPYRILGRTPLASEPIEALLGLASLATAAASGAQLMRLLESPWMARLFGLEQRDLERVRHWIVESGMRRDDERLPRHGWEAAIERLLMGAALDDADPGFADVAARGAPTGTAIGALDGLLALVDTIESLRRMARSPRSVDRWAIALNALMDRLLAGASGEDAAGFLEVRRALDALATGSRQASADLRVSLEVMLAALRAELAEQALGGAPSGTVTFAPPGMLRGLPHRVIAWLGMDDGVYPRVRKAPMWDLLALAPRRGDRMHGIDDRGEFLDSLIAAADRFLVVYTGRDLQTNEPLAPSLLVSELLDHLHAVCGEGAARVREWPLHAYSPSLFDAAAPLSFAAELVEAARAAAGDGATLGSRGKREAVADTVTEAAVDAGLRSAPMTVELDALIDFFRDPARAYARARLGIAMQREREDIPEDATFVPDALRRSLLRRRALALAARGIDPGTIAAHLVHDPFLPEGAAGRVMAQVVAAQAVDYRQRLEALGAAREPVRVELAFGLVRLHGRLEGLRDEGLVLERVGKVGAVHQVEGWIRHLALNAIAAAGSAGGLTTILPFDPAENAVRFEPVAADAACTCLARLLDAWQQGMERPLALPAATAIAAAAQRSTRTIASAYFGSDWGDRRGDADDPWFRAVFGEQIPDLHQVVVPLAREVYQGYPGPKRRRGGT